MKSDIKVRIATEKDTDTIIKFNKEMAFETENKVLSEQELKDGVTAVFRDAHKGFYVVAELDSMVIGQALITFEWSDWRNKNFWWIQSVYVSPNYRRLGVFKTLFNAIVDMARSANDVCGIRLYVEKGNKVAKAVYSSLGMAESHYDMYEMMI